MKRLLVWALVALWASVVAVPATAKFKRLGLVEGQVVEDGAGRDHAMELDFSRLEVTATSETLELHIETHTPWLEIPNPQAARIAVFVAKAGAAKFYPNIYAIFVRVDGTLTVETEYYPGTSRFDKKKKAWEGEADRVEASLDGASIDIAIPWDDLPAERIWLQVAAHHAKGQVDEDMADSDIEFVGGRANSEPSDFVPNYDLALSAIRPTD